MGYRLSKIYTRTGDRGDTGLADGSRRSKGDARLEAIGSIDELNSLIGILSAMAPPSAINDILLEIQHRLFDLGGELAMPGHLVMKEAWVTSLEGSLDTLNADLPPLEEFILPGGNPPATHCHHARAVCRRAERRLIQLADITGEQVNPVAVKYLNRLSDLLFVIARTLARQNGGCEVYWSKQP